MSKNLFNDLRSGFFISLIALPLCLGIAIASSFPPIAGVITAMVGGLIVSLFGGCKLSIKGPAAGLIVIVLGSVLELGEGDPILGYKRTLAVGVIASLLQIIFALFKTARFGRLMPPSVIHGMLSAIGIIIIAKQIHILVGAIPHGKTTFELLSEIPESILNINPELAFIGIFTLLIMGIFPLIPSRFVKTIPPALLALLVVVPISLYWHLDSLHTYSLFERNFTVGPTFLVNIPENFSNFLAFPDFSILTNIAAYKYVLMLGLIGSVESVLTVIAIDNIGKHQKKSNLNRDLLGVGVGNLICSLIGGLPMISEVVRSKANIDNGATSGWSNFFHGAFLLLAVTFFAPIIREIPLAALAAMLMITGLRLASINQFKHIYHIGLDQFLLFISTLIVTLATDLLVGITVGTALKILMHYFRGVKYKELFWVNLKIEKNLSFDRMIIIGPAIFTNYFSLQKQIIDNLKNTKALKIDFSNASLIDHTTLFCLDSLIDEMGSNRLEIVGLESLKRISGHKLSTHRMVRDA